MSFVCSNQFSRSGEAYPPLDPSLDVPAVSWHQGSSFRLCKAASDYSGHIAGYGSVFYVQDHQGDLSLVQNFGRRLEFEFWLPGRERHPREHPRGLPHGGREGLRYGHGHRQRGGDARAEGRRGGLARDVHGRRHE